MNPPSNLVYTTNSWHYRLIVYVFTTEFFLEIDGIDIQAMDATAINKDFRIIYKKKPRTVNLCPYCRAIVGAVIIFPFVVLYRLFPHKKKIRTHEEIRRISQRNSKIAIIGAMVSLGVIGVWNLTTGNYLFAAFNFGLVVFNLFGVRIITWILKRMPKRKFKEKPTKEPKQPSKIIKTISEKHDLICPPIYFIDKSDEENLI